MRPTLLAAAFLVAAMRAEEPRPASMREKLRAKVVESAAAVAPAKPVEEKGARESPVVLMKPVVVSESRRASDFERAMAREKQQKEEERFSVTKGGTLYRNGRLKIGGWWDESQGWSFLKITW